MPKKTKTAAQHLGELHDKLQWMIENGEDTYEIRAEIEQARIDVEMEKAENK